MPWLPDWLRDLICALQDLRSDLVDVKTAIAEVHAEQHRMHHTLTSLVAKEAHEATVLAAIQDALSAVDLPPGKLEAVNSIVQANLAKLRGVIASAPAPSK